MSNHVTFVDDKGFNGRIGQCIDKALDTFGAGVKRSLYYQMEREYHLSSETIAIRPAEAIECLRQLLGSTGSTFVERLVVREIRSAFGLQFGNSESLSDVINEARRKFLGVSDKGTM